jgi:hypothetical protein
VRLICLTCTGERPEAFALCQRWMARQTRQPEEWLILSHRDGLPAGIARLLRTAQLRDDDLLLFVEDDDWYSPRYLEVMAGAASERREAEIIGCNAMNCYHLVERGSLRNVNAAGCSTLSQTAIRGRRAQWALACAVEDAAAAGGHDVDGRLWTGAKRLGAESFMVEPGLYVGMKGMPGRAGYGPFHAERAGKWIPDPTGEKLVGWIGSDYNHYAEVMGW